MIHDENAMVCETATDGTTGEIWQFESVMANERSNGPIRGPTEEPRRCSEFRFSPRFLRGTLEVEEEPRSDERSWLTPLDHQSWKGPTKPTFLLPDGLAQTDYLINVLFAKRQFNDNHLALRQLVP